MKNYYHDNLKLETSEKTDGCIGCIFSKENATFCRRLNMNNTESCYKGNVIFIAIEERPKFTGYYNPRNINSDPGFPHEDPRL